MMTGMFRFLFLGLIYAAFAATVARAQTAEINIMAGPSKSTSLEITEELQEVGQSCGVEMTIYQSSGALDNLLAVKKRRNTQFGVIQSDVLEYLRTYEPDVPDIERAMRGITVAFPLYPQEVQVLARKEIETFADLAGKRVAIGDQESGTFLTATVILDLSALSDVVRIAENPDTALEALVLGEIDALFFVDGAPSPVFGESSIDFSQIHLLAIDDPVLAAVYEPAVIGADTYSFMEQDVSTVAVRAVMLAYDYAPARNRYNEANCNAVSQVTNLVAQKLGELQENGHPKWREVDPSASFGDWKTARCAEQGITRGRPLSCEQ